MFRLTLTLALLTPLLTAQAPGQTSGQVPAQSPAPTLPGIISGSPFKIISPLNMPTVTPGVIHLLELEARFASDVAAGGGKAFASWFADDAVTLSNGKPAVFGRGAIAASADWDARQYSLTWTPQGAQMGPSNDMGFTWGHYEGRTTPAPGGTPLVRTGRYITVWRKLPDGSWKVVLDASSDEPPNAADCCALPKP